VNDAARRAVLADGSRAMGVPLSAAQLDAALHYLALLQKWNATFNLTAIRDPDEMVVKHLLDSFAVVPHLAPVAPGARLIDVGTGAGLPGIPLALVEPTLAVTLLDTNAKKTRFCTQAAVELKLANVTVVQARVEEHRPERPYDLIISRAFAEVLDFLTWTAHLGGPATRWLAMKGAATAAELAKLPPGFRMRARHPLTVPGLDAERHLVEFERV
jgi:16S rRNA (guanine527-N7)-methyltransferase